MAARTNPVTIPSGLRLTRDLNDALTIWSSSKRAVNSPDDLKGLKIRTMENPVHLAAFRALGALPTPMAWPEVIPALQQHTIDGQENPISVIVSAKLSQVQKYLSLTRHVYSPTLFLMAPKDWNALSDADKKAFLGAATAGKVAMRKFVDDVEQRGVAELRKQGMQVDTEIDASKFQAQLGPAYTQYAKKFGQATPDRDPREVVAAHVRRLEALRRAGIVEREAEGVWRVPDDLAERGRQYDAQRLGSGVAVELKSHLPIERQTRVIGATWLDQQLIGGGKALGDSGFGSEVKGALQQRADFLAEQGLAERRGQRVFLTRNLLATLCGRELAQAAKEIAAETGLEHRPVADNQRVTGIYRRSVMLASGRYAMLDDGMGFSLVPWKPVIEQRLGQQIAATVRGGGVSWEIGRLRGHSIN